jgi:hypothetical protein
VWAPFNAITGQQESTMRLFYWNGYRYNFGDAMGPDIVKKVAGKNIGAIDGAKVGKNRKYE